MFTSVDFSRVTFAEPGFLWFLIVPAVALVAWAWRALVRRRDARRLARGRSMPVRERYAWLADLPFWLALTLASGLLIVAAARPQGPAISMRRGGVDIVVLQDGSASMRVQDVEGDRWRRSVKLVRLIADSLSWQDDRMALSLFAHVATPQVRLTKDPNTFFFFLDHLGEEPPYRLEEDTSWDSNAELGIHWGLRMLERDEELNGRSPNATIFVLISDGETWSGDIGKAIDAAQARGVPIFVVGVGTLAGAPLPDAVDAAGEPMKDSTTPSRSMLARDQLMRISSSGGGQYFEIGREPDRDIANAIIDAGRRLAPSLGSGETKEDLHWRAIVLAPFLLALGLVFVRDRQDLVLAVVVAGSSLLYLSSRI